MDTLFEIRNNYHLGNYQSCINVASRFRSYDESQQTECDFYMYLSYFEQRAYGVVLSEIIESKPACLLYIKKLAEYRQGDRAKKDSIILDLDKTIDTIESNELSCLIVSAIYAQDNNTISALKVLHPIDTIASSAAKIQLYLSIDRPDLARKQLKQMQDKDEYATLTQLATAWMNLYMGGMKLQEAYYIIQELVDKHGATPLLLNIQVCSLMSRLMFEEANELCQRSFVLDGNNPETLVNLIVLSLHSGQSNEFTSRYFNQLKDLYPYHAYVIEYMKQEARFDELLIAQSTSYAI